MEFADLNIPVVGRDSVAARLEMLHRLGYGAAAINQTLSGKIPSQVTDATGVPVRCPQLPESFRQFSRVTVVLDDVKDAYVLNGTTPHLKAFDIVAVQPTNEKLFAQCCGTLEVDIISLDLSSRMAFFVKAPPVGLAIERGIFFEITYSPAITDSTARRSLISNALSLVRMTKGRNIILSSGAEAALGLRNPYDAANLTRLFGFSLEAAKGALQANCRATIMHAHMRRQTLKGVLHVSLPAAAAQAGSAVMEDDDS